MEPAGDESQSYVERLRADSASQTQESPRLAWLSRALVTPWNGTTRCVLRHSSGGLSEESFHSTPQSLIEKQARIPYRTVCIIESIGPQWMEALGKAWNLDTLFFLTHASKPISESAWDAVFHVSDNQTSFSSGPLANHEHISGVFEYLGWESKISGQIDSRPNFMSRVCSEGPTPYPPSSHTTLSYCRVKPGLCRL
jgi:hypothetical protein